MVSSRLMAKITGQLPVVRAKQEPPVPAAPLALGACVEFAGGTPGAEPQAEEFPLEGGAVGQQFRRVQLQVLDW